MARKIPKNFRHITGHVSDGQGGSLPFEGPLEIDFYTLMTHQRSIDRIETQSITIEHLDAIGRKTRYTPEAVIHFKKDLRVRPLLVEVKPSKTLKKDWDELQWKVRAGIRQANEMGWTFKVYTEREIRTLYLENVKVLRIHRGHEFSDEQIDRVQSLVAASPGITFEEVLRRLEPRKQGEEWLMAHSLVYHCLVAGKISTDLFKLLAYTKPLFPPGTWLETPWDKRWLRRAAPPPLKFRKGW